MTDIPGLPGGVLYDDEHNVARALLSMAAPPLVPDDATIAAAADEEQPMSTLQRRLERSLPIASWLDAMPPVSYEAPSSDADHISSVNSDDNGLYRMFIGVSP